MVNATRATISGSNSVDCLTRAANYAVTVGGLYPDRSQLPCADERSNLDLRSVLVAPMLGRSRRKVANGSKSVRSSINVPMLLASRLIYSGGVTTRHGWSLRLHGNTAHMVFWLQVPRA